MKLIKIIDKNKTYKSKNGKEYCSINYYLVAENGKYIPIRPVFAQGYNYLDAICETIVNG